jgi:D-alanyl-D-alanine-carboxypeptidase/D-alanyl-D-alanine-endopeptidase
MKGHDERTPSHARHQPPRLAARIWYRFQFALFINLLAAAPVFAETHDLSLPSDTVIRNMLITRIDVQHRGTGAIVVIVTPTGRRTIAYGSVAERDKRPVNGDTIFDVASITKVFTALLLADMAQHGEIGLEDPVSQDLTGHAKAIPARNGRPITLLDLATHTAGLPLRPSNLISKDPDNKYDGYTPDLLYEFLSTYELPRDPGTEYEYSNVGYGLLGQVLSSKSGLSYEELLHRRITGPLEMRSTTLADTANMKRRATGYTTEGQAVKDAERGALDASGALHSTANDLSKLIEVALGYRKSPLASIMGSMVKTRRPGGMAPWATQIALAWNITNVGNREIVWKNGSAGGFRSFVGYDETLRIGVIGLINVQSDLGVDDIGMHLLGADVPVDIHVPRAHTEVAINPALLDRYVGRYHFSDTDIMTIVREGDRLFYAPVPEQRLELFAESDNEFFLKEVDAQVTFEVPTAGLAVAAIWHQWGQDQRGERIPERETDNHQ